jgi:DNA polymerase
VGDSENEMPSTETERAQALEQLNAEVRSCPKCPLSQTRRHAVPGEGPLDAEVMFIGEGPGYHEDAQGRPFVGPAGRFLDELLQTIGLQRDQVYITSVVKCRPPGNRDPAPNEIAACAPYLDRQLEIVNPKVIVTLGRYSMARFFPGQSISRIHGQAKREGNRAIFAMYHPAAALHRQDLQPVLRQDMLKIPALLKELRRQGPVQSSQPGQEDDDEPQQLSLF